MNLYENLNIQLEEILKEELIDNIERLDSFLNKYGFEEIAAGDTFKFTTTVDGVKHDLEINDDEIIYTSKGETESFKFSNDLELQSILKTLGTRINTAGGSFPTPKEFIDVDANVFYAVAEDKLCKLGFVRKNGMRPKLIGATYAYVDFIYEGNYKNLIRVYKDKVIYADAIESHFDSYTFDKYIKKYEHIDSVDELNRVLDEILKEIDGRE